MEDIDRLLPQVKMEPPCTPASMAAFLGYAGHIPHDDYLAFMRRHNGCAGPVGEQNFVKIWPTDEVILADKELEVSENAPGLLLFAGDGANEGYAFDRRMPTWPIVLVPLMGLSLKEAVVIASTFSEFVKRLASDELPFPPE